jgi:hypothetical protein
VKKFIVFALVFALALSLVAIPVYARSDSAKGAVKLPINERISGDPADQIGSGPESGWAVVNTNANGMINIEVHMDNAEAEESFNVIPKINDDWVTGGVGQLTTNIKGKGNFHVQLDLSDYPPSTNTVDVQIVVKPVGTSAVVGYASAITEIPLK